MSNYVNYFLNILYYPSLLTSFIYILNTSEKLNTVNSRNIEVEGALHGLLNIRPYMSPRRPKKGQFFNFILS